MDNIKRNPNRSRDINVTQYQNYKPEYKKLNLKPINAQIHTQSIQDPVQQELDFPEQEEVQQEEHEQYVEQEHNEYVNDEYFELPINQCMLTIYGEVVKIGSLDAIKREISVILNGQHPKYDQAIELNDLIVVKRLNIRYGVMVE